MTMTERVQIVEISPAAAEKLLSTANHGNRNIRSSVVKMLVTAIEQGAMLLAPDAIAVTGPSLADPGRLLNGQHRLAACLESQSPIRVIAYFGADPSVFEVCDRQSRRSAADLLSMGGVPNANAVAGVCNIISGYGTNSRLEPREARALVETYPDLTDFVAAHTNAARVVTNAGAALVAALYVCQSGEDRASGEDFANQVLYGEGLNRGAPAYALRHRLMELRSKSHREPPCVTFSVVLHCFVNFFLRGSALHKIYAPPYAPIVKGSPFGKAAAARGREVDGGDDVASETGLRRMRRALRVGGRT